MRASTHYPTRRPDVAAIAGVTVAGENIGMIDRFEVIGHNSPRPNAKRIIFCDGTGGRIYQPDNDLELSHWRPNLTPAEYRAGTSTEICFRFLDSPRDGPAPWTVAVNNHVDVDGILSVYVLVHSGHALRNRQTIIEAAEMGDFWGWGEPPAQRVFQGLTFLMESGIEPTAIYDESFRRIPLLIEGSDPQVFEIEQSLAPLREGLELVDNGTIIRRERGNRFVQYVIPREVAGESDARASYAPEFNEAISAKAALWPHVRARRDSQRVNLVSAERNAGWFHDLCFPGYHWADTEGKWLVPGMTYHEGMTSYSLRLEPLIAAVESLARQETAPGRWVLGGTDMPLGKELQKHFPVVGRFVDELLRPATSHLPPDEVAESFEEVFQGIQ